MRAPPNPESIGKGIFQSNVLTDEADILALSRKVEPTFERSRAKAIVAEIEELFWAALGFNHEQIPQSKLTRFYEKLAKDVQRLAKTLSLPTNPIAIASKCPFGIIAKRSELPDGLYWLFDAATDGLHQSGDFSSLVASALKNPEGPSDWKRKMRKGSFCDEQLSSLPFLLALALGSAQEALREIGERPRYENWERRFLRRLFGGLVAVHVAHFGRVPQVRDGDNLPQGSGVHWTQGILKIAAKKIDGCYIRPDHDPFDTSRMMIHLVKRASCLARETIADRLAAGIKNHKAQWRGSGEGRHQIT
jgi:hypothetical protein